MSYTKTTDFAAKDALLSGNPAKLIRGTEIDDEFDAIQVADAQNVKTVSSTDNAVVRFNGTSGQVQNSGVTIDDSNVMTVSSMVTTTADINGGTIDGTTIGATTPAAGTFTAITDSGNLAFTGTAQRITGDFSNATVANRVTVQSSTTNGETDLMTLPNGTSTSASVGAINAATPTNASYSALWALSAEVRLDAGKYGSGTYLPMTFYTGGSERMRIDTSGNVGVGVAPNANWGAAAKAIEGQANNAISFNPGSVVINANLYNNSGIKYATSSTAAAVFAYDSGVVELLTYPAGTAGNAPSAPATWFSLDQTNVLMKSANGGLGYGTGAGGTVTQATSKSTAVTLNKPTGRITTAADALAAGAIVSFTFNNSLFSTSDNLVLTQVANTAGNYQLWTNNAGTGSVVISIKNNAGTSQSEALAINFAILKGATA